MASFSEVTIEGVKNQLNEYHLMVAEILSGIDTEVTTLQNSLLEDKENYKFEISSLRDEIESLKRSVKILQIEMSKLLENNIKNQ